MSVKAIDKNTSTQKFQVGDKVRVNDRTPGYITLTMKAPRSIIEAWYDIPQSNVLITGLEATAGERWKVTAIRETVSPIPYVHI